MKSDTSKAEQDLAKAKEILRQVQDSGSTATLAAGF